MSHNVAYANIHRGQLHRRPGAVPTTDKRQVSNIHKVQRSKDATLARTASQKAKGDTGGYNDERSEDSSNPDYYSSRRNSPSKNRPMKHLNVNSHPDSDYENEKQDVLGSLERATSTLEKTASVNVNGLCRTQTEEPDMYYRVPVGNSGHSVHSNNSNNGATGGTSTHNTMYNGNLNMSGNINMPPPLPAAFSGSTQFGAVSPTGSSGLGASGHHNYYLPQSIPNSIPQSPTTSNLDHSSSHQNAQMLNSIMGSMNLPTPPASQSFGNYGQNSGANSKNSTNHNDIDLQKAAAAGLVENSRLAAHLNGTNSLNDDLQLLVDLLRMRKGNVSTQDASAVKNLVDLLASKDPKIAEKIAFNKGSKEPVSDGSDFGGHSQPLNNSRAQNSFNRTPSSITSSSNFNRTMTQATSGGLQSVGSVNTAVSGNDFGRSMTQASYLSAGGNLITAESLQTAATQLTNPGNFIMYQPVQALTQGPNGQLMTAPSAVSSGFGTAVGGAQQLTPLNVNGQFVAAGQPIMFQNPDGSQATQNIMYPTNSLISQNGQVFLPTQQFISPVDSNGSANNQNGEPSSFGSNFSTGSGNFGNFMPLPQQQNSSTNNLSNNSGNTGAYDPNGLPNMNMGQNNNNYQGSSSRNAGSTGQKDGSSRRQSGDEYDYSGLQRTDSTGGPPVQMSYENYYSQKKGSTGGKPTGSQKSSVYNPESRETTRQSNGRSLNGSSNQDNDAKKNSKKKPSNRPDMNKRLVVNPGEATVLSMGTAKYGQVPNALKRFSAVSDVWTMKRSSEVPVSEGGSLKPENNTTSTESEASVTGNDAEGAKMAEDSKLTDSLNSTNAASNQQQSNLMIARKIPMEDLKVLDSLIWTVDAKKLQSTDKVLVSPHFTLNLEDRSKGITNVKFRINLYPADTECNWNDQGSFKSSRGRAKAILKCDSWYDAEQHGSKDNFKICARVFFRDQRYAQQPQFHDFTETCNMTLGTGPFDATKFTFQRELAMGLEICLRRDYEDESVNSNLRAYWSGPQEPKGTSGEVVASQ